MDYKKKYLKYKKKYFKLKNQKGGKLYLDFDNCDKIEEGKITNKYVFKANLENQIFKLYNDNPVKLQTIISKGLKQDYYLCNIPNITLELVE